MKYRDRIAVVTDAGSGIGRALTLALTHGRGARGGVRRGPERPG